MELLVEGTQEQVALARELGHKEIIVLHTDHRGGARSARPSAAGTAAPTQSQARGRELRGMKTAALARTANQAKALKGRYDYVVAPCAREFFESRFVDFILEPENGNRQDFIHHRNSGLNQVLLKLCQATAKRPGKAIITTTSLLLNAKRPETVLGRMMQNARWCRKYKIAYHVTSGARSSWEQRDAEGLKAVGRILLTGHKA